MGRWHDGTLGGCRWSSRAGDGTVVFCWRVWSVSGRCMQDGEAVQAGGGRGRQSRVRGMLGSLGERRQAWDRP